MAEFLEDLDGILGEDVANATAEEFSNSFRVTEINDNIAERLKKFPKGLSFGGDSITEIKVDVDSNGEPTIQFGKQEPVSIDEFNKNVNGEAPTADTEGVEPNLESSFKVMFGEDFNIDSDPFKDFQEKVSSDWKTTNEPTRNVTSENARATDKTRAREEKLAQDLKNAQTPEERAQLMKDYLKENFGDSLGEDTIDNAEEEIKNNEDANGGKFLKVAKGVAWATLIGAAGLGLYGALKAHQQALNGCWVTTRDGSRWKIRDLTCNQFSREKLAVQGQSLYNSSNVTGTISFAPVCNESSGCVPTQPFQFNLCPQVLLNDQGSFKAGTSVFPQMCGKPKGSSKNFGNCNKSNICNTNNFCDNFSGCPTGGDNDAWDINATMSDVKCNNCYVITKDKATQQPVEGTNLLTCANDKNKGKWCSNTLCNSQYVRLPSGASITCVSVSLAGAASDWFNTVIPNIENFLKKILMIVLYVVLGIIGVALVIGLIKLIINKAMGK